MAVESPAWYRRRSAVFALLFAVGFLGGWGISQIIVGRYEPAFATIGTHWGPHGPLIAGLAALLVVLAAMSVRVWGASYLSASTVWDEEVHTESLIVAGPFRFVRHPLYLGNMLLAAGLGAAAPLSGWIFIIVANALFIRSLIAFEEERLAIRYGEAYRRYRCEVPAMLPRLTPAPAHQLVPPSVTQGLKAESFTMFLLAGVIGLFAVPRFGVLVLVFCYIAGVLVQRRIESKSGER